MEMLPDQEPAEPTLIELELLPVEPPEDRPLNEAFRLLALRTSYVAKPGARRRDPLWCEPELRRPAPWPDCSVRRVLDLPYAVAARALDAVIENRPVTDDANERRVPGTLRLHRHGRRVRVELVIAPWSRRRTELRLQLTGRLTRSPRYIEIASEVTHRLHDLITDRASFATDPLLDPGPLDQGLRYDVSSCSSVRTP